MCDTVGGRFDFNWLIGHFFYDSRGSPMVIGVKCADQLTANHIPVMFSKGKYWLL